MLSFCFRSKTNQSDRKRFLGVVEFVEKVSKEPEVRACCASWRIISSVEQKEESRGNSHDAKVIRNHRRIIEAELSKIAKSHLSTTDDLLVVHRQLASTIDYCRRRNLYYMAPCNLAKQILKHQRPEISQPYYSDHFVLETRGWDMAYCKNCMVLLRLLSEEVLDVSWGEESQQKTKYLKQSLNSSEFQLILDLCFEILSNPHRNVDICATLIILHDALSWIPLGYIFASDWHNRLLKFLYWPSYQNLALQCFTKVASLQLGKFDNLQLNKMFGGVISFLWNILDYTMVRDVYAEGDIEKQDFIQNLALFLTSFFKFHIQELQPNGRDMDALKVGLQHLLKISYADDTEVYNVCLDYWNFFVSELFEAQTNYYHTTTTTGSQTMRETLIYLSHLDREDNSGLMLVELSKLYGEDWSLKNLNKLCWAIGSISGIIAEEQKNRFPEMTIWDLFDLFEIKDGIDNNAIIASNIIYVVGHYPKFLKGHWKILKAVVKKLFEFMHVKHRDVQEDACDTFLNIVQKCKHEFVIVQAGEREAFVSELLFGFAAIVSVLEADQIHTFYESVATMVQAESDISKRDEYLEKLMQLPNQRLTRIIGHGCQSVNLLKDQDLIRTVPNILQMNRSVASSLGMYFFPQMSLIFLDILNMYRMCNELLSSMVAEGGPDAFETSSFQLLRSIKRETLKLIETFLDKAEGQPHIGTQFVPPLMDSVLIDYVMNPRDAREPEVLSLFATIINKYKDAMIDDLPRIFEAVFQCAWEMIVESYKSPNHCLKLLSLLRAINTHCFDVLSRLSPQLKLVMDFVTYAFRLNMRNPAETGLNLLIEILKNFQDSELCDQFYKAYFVQVETDIFTHSIYTFRKYTTYDIEFDLHVTVLHRLLCLVECGKLMEPLWDAATAEFPYPSNAAFVRDFTIKLIGTSFPDKTTSEVIQFVNGLFDKRLDRMKFKYHIRGFIAVQTECSAQENEDLYAEEVAAAKTGRKFWN